MKYDAGSGTMYHGRGFPCRQRSGLIFKPARSGGMRGDNRAARLRVAR